MRNIRKIIQSAQSLTGDAMRRQFGQHGNDELQLATRVDIGMRMGVLGLGAATATIFGALAQSSNTIPLLIGGALASTALVGLHWLKSAKNPQMPFLAISGIWTAGLAFMISMHPAAASMALAASLMLIGRARIFKMPENDSVETHEIESADAAQLQQENAGLRLDRMGALMSGSKIDGLSLEIGDQLVDRVHVADRVEYLRALSQLRAGEIPSLVLQLRLNTADKTQAASFVEFNIEMSLQGDVVELKHAAISDTEFYLVSDNEDSGSDKRFLTIVSHELRTPLNAIIGFSDVLRGDLGEQLPEATRNEYIELIHGAGTHLLSLVNTILDVSKIESGTYTIDRDEFDFPQTARECMAMLGPQAKQKNILINDRITCAANNVNGDRRALKQVLINLLSNAIKYTEPNGYVTVDAHINDAELVFEVSDTGIGMCSADLEMIGKPFAQVDNSITRSNEGTGLGLALIKGLIELHGGRLEISSKVGVGTNVKVHIPNEPEQLRNNNLSSLQPLVDREAPPSESASDHQQISRKGIGHGTRKVG